MWCECESSAATKSRSEGKKKAKSSSSRNWHEKLIQFIKVKSLLASDKRGMRKQKEVNEETKREGKRKKLCHYIFLKQTFFFLAPFSRKNVAAFGGQQKTQVQWRGTGELLIFHRESFLSFHRLKDFRKEKKFFSTLGTFTNSQTQTLIRPCSLYLSLVTGR